jgi:3-oxo-4-pregnene-20-carboxyl-CoA dehydrogenase alpha subunit
MNIDLSEEARAYGKTAADAFKAAGAVDLIEQAERDPARGESMYGPILRDLGVWQLHPRTDPDDLEAAAALCRAAGYWCVAYPLAERLTRPKDQNQNQNQDQNDALALVLPCWTLLGMLDRALDLTRAHILVRQQFGQPLSAFQGVQFQLTDAEVERAGLDMLAKYALWSVQTGQPGQIEDALALRMAALEAAEVVFRVAHQLHGALGFCDEAPLSWLSRCSQPLRRLPLGLSATRAELTARLGRRGLAGLFHD